ncbi:heterokaryon incompatibility protein-domain-containing protein [Xylaria acuta]|nr:heterokaryon incompatibility protein-domain-containing protein [Xylaria acuta]
MLSKFEIRLLDLLPSATSNSDNAPIRCQSRVVPLSANESFEALSYVWGTEPNFTKISLDGNDVLITSSLAAALRRARLPGTTRVLWADQLSINQFDDQEKANQVPLMTHIYTKTTQCLIWLGEMKPDISLSDAQSALDLIHHLSDPEKNKMSDLSLEKNLHRSIHALDSISMTENKWWTRTWTLQESILPSKACVLWGPLTIQWETLASAGSNWVNSPHDLVLDPYLDNLNNLFTQTNGILFSKRQHGGPLEITFRWGFRWATNPLDKVYGLLGLFPTGGFTRVRKCNYQLQPATVYAMFTVDLIEHHKTLHPLALKFLQRPGSRMPGLPSWGLDLSDGNQKKEEVRVDRDDYIWYMKNTYDCYVASGKTEVNSTRLQYDQNSNTLRLTGIVIDDIAVAVPQPTEDVPGTSNITCAGVPRLVQEWYQIAEGFYTNPEWLHLSWQASFWRGLLGNLTLGGENEPRAQATQEDVALAQRFVEFGERNSICPSLFASISHRKMIITATGLLGFAPHDADVGDQVWILHGGRMPFVLRAKDGLPRPKNEYILIGASYVHEIMDGRAADHAKSSCEIVLN